MKGTIFVIIALTGLLFAQTYTASDYFPLGVGYVWNYLDSTSSSDSVSIWTTEITGDTTIDGYPSYIVTTTGDSSYTSYYEVRDDGIYYFIMDAFWAKMLSTTFSLGDVWDVATIDTDMTDSTYGMTYHLHSYMYSTVVGTDDITTPAGEFDDCIHTIITNQFEVSVGGYTMADTINQFENWYAYGVGGVYSISVSPNPMAPETTYSFLREYDLSKVAETKLTPQTLAINAYPNPFNSSCEIDVPQGTQNILITDLLGKTVADIPLSDTKAIWKPTAQSPSGIYLIEAIKDGNPMAKTSILYMK